MADVIAVHVFLHEVIGLCHAAVVDHILASREVLVDHRDEFF